MKYIVSWTLPAGTFHTAIDRFLKGGGATPAGVKLVARYHGMSGRGFAIVETTDAKGLFAWVCEWSDLLPLETTPCVEDADAAAVMGAVKR